MEIRSFQNFAEIGIKLCFGQDFKKISKKVARCERYNIHINVLQNDFLGYDAIIGFMLNLYHKFWYFRKNVHPEWNDIGIYWITLKMIKNLKINSEDRHNSIDLGSWTKI